MLRKGLPWLSGGVLSLWLAIPTVAWAEGVVGVASVKGAGAAAVEAELVNAFKKSGWRVVTDKEAKKLKGLPADRFKALGAQFMVEATIGKAKGGAVVKADLIDLEVGSPVGHAEKPFKGKAAGPAGHAVASAMVQAAGVPGAVARASLGGGKAPPEPPASGEINRERLGVPPSASPATPPPAEATAASPPTETARVEPEAPRGKGGAPFLRVGLDVGSQAMTAYTVVVGGNSTALAYKLSPLLLIGLGARVDIGSTHLGVEAGGSFAPVKFSLNIQPPVTPSTPSAHFIDIGGNILYTLNLGKTTVGTRSSFDLEPLLGARFESFGIDPQTKVMDMSATNIVLSQSAFVPHLGLRARLGFGDSVEIEAEGRGRLVASFSESPSTTGTSGGGFGVAFGLDGRYWLSSTLGFGLGLAYDFLSISLKGAGTRPTFEKDPPLNDASIPTANLRVTASALLAL